jgi:hypothetical protein
LPLPVKTGDKIGKADLSSWLADLHDGVQE